MTKSSSGKPPGLIANNIQIDLQSIEKLWDDALGNTTEELTVGAISFSTQADPVQENSRERSDQDPSWETENDIPQLGEVSDTDDDWMEALFEDDLSIDQIQKKEQSSSPEQSEDGESSSTADTDNEDLTTVVMGPLMTFSWGEESYDKMIRHPEEKLDLLWKEEKNRGRPKTLGSATTQKLERMLESMQPYPGDPSNCLQYRGRRFVADDISDLEMSLWDLV
ncbi:hypothetical protein C0993_009313 [Termitomyces sp. T159_Od127]|nr:hypothetical protein C0993_009313 [Termitomyces sp. T159_Od127]